MCIRDSYRGFGTQKAEEELAELFPEARVLRMDQDSTAAKDAHEKLLAKFARHEYDIMVGTQMVAKGLDFEDVTLVGVLGIDSLLFAQGFRAYETVFSLITQVVGRSGRAKDPGFEMCIRDSSSPPAKTGHAQDHMRYVPSLFMGGYADRSRYMYPRLGTQAHVTIHMLLFYSDSRFFASREDKKVDAKSPPQHCEGLGCLCCFIRRDETYLQNLHGLHPRPVPWHCASQRTWERPAGTWRRSGRPLPA